MITLFNENITHTDIKFCNIGVVFYQGQKYPEIKLLDIQALEFERNLDFMDKNYVSKYIDDLIIKETKSYINLCPNWYKPKQQYYGFFCLFLIILVIIISIILLIIENNY